MNMDKNLIKKEIRDLMEVIQEQQITLLSYNDRIPRIETDILMGNLRKVYELFIELSKTENETPPVKQYPVESTQPEKLLAKVEIPVPVTESIFDEEPISAATTPDWVEEKVEERAPVAEVVPVT